MGEEQKLVEVNVEVSTWLIGLALLFLADAANDHWKRQDQLAVEIAAAAHQQVKP